MRKTASQTTSMPLPARRGVAAGDRLRSITSRLAGAVKRTLAPAGPRRLAAWSLAAGAIVATPAAAQLPQTAYVPAPYGEAGAPPPPQAAPVYSQDPAAIWPQQAGEAYHPYPAISPYGNFNTLSTTHVNRGGTWFKKIYQRDREFHFDARATWFNFDEAGKAVVGSEPLPGATSGIQIRNQGGRSNPNQPFVFGGVGNQNNQNNQGQGGGNADLTPGALLNIQNQLPPDFVFLGPGTFPYPFLADDTAPTTGADLEAYIRNDIHPVRTLRSLGEANSGGVRLNWGWDNGDGSGVEFFGVYSGLADSSFSRGRSTYRGMQINAAVLISQPANFVSLINGSIPLDTGLPTFPELGDALKIRGFSQKYDVFYGLDNEIQIFNGGLLAFAQNLYEGDAVRLRMFWGAEYMHVDENFTFNGIDSGSSGFDEDLQPNGGIIGGGGGGGGTGNLFFSQVTALQFATPTLTEFSVDRFFEAFLESEVQSHIAGPTVGLRYDFGNRNSDFQLSGTTTFGLFANHERKVVFGENIGEQTAMKTIYGIDFLTDAATGTPLPDGATAFKATEDSTHVSPMIRQAIDASIAVGAIVPPLRDTDFFGDCRLQVGYGVQLLGEVQRAGDQIRWRGFPDFPTIEQDRTSLLTQEANVGLQWTY